MKLDWEKTLHDWRARLECPRVWFSAYQTGAAWYAEAEFELGRRTWVSVRTLSNTGSEARAVCERNAELIRAWFGGEDGEGAAD